MARRCWLGRWEVKVTLRVSLRGAGDKGPTWALSKAEGTGQRASSFSIAAVTNEPQLGGLQRCARRPTRSSPRDGPRASGAPRLSGTLVTTFPVAPSCSWCHLHSLARGPCSGRREGQERRPSRSRHLPPTLLPPGVSLLRHLAAATATRALTASQPSPHPRRGLRW